MTELGELHLHRLLVAVDGYNTAELALSAAPNALQQEADDEAERLLNETVERLPADIPVTKRLRHGKAGPEIVAQARECDYDAILLGARGVGRVHALVGSVSSYVLHHADTAVFVAHSPRGD
jgi:nucleotide-binding universal stress UspA family protein